MKRADAKDAERVLEAQDVGLAVIRSNQRNSSQNKQKEARALLRTV